MKERLIGYVCGCHALLLLACLFHISQPTAVPRKLQVHTVALRAPSPAAAPPVHPQAAPVATAPPPAPTPKPTPTPSKPKSKAASKAPPKPAKKQTSKQASKPANKAPVPVPKTASPAPAPRTREALAHLDAARALHAAVSVEGLTASYADRLVEALQRALRLPEYGEVQLQLTLATNGRVLRVTTVKTQSAANRAYLEATLPTLLLPPCGDKEQTLLLHIGNQ